MNTVLLEKPTGPLADKQLPAARLAPLRSWLLSWEIYPILLVAAFLRLYEVNRSEFDTDQANLFQMARYAVTHGLLPATANIASVGIYIPPATVDIFMLPAALSSDPLGGAITVGVLGTVSVLLTYGFMRCYYGRVAATIAALMYATLLRAVFSSRTIWNPNLLPFFIMLFFIALFRGVVARRKGWLFPALLLLGILIQLHATAGMFIIPLGIAFVLAPGTIRWRDLALGLLSLLIIYFPYLLWEMAIHFQDIYVLMQTSLFPQQKAVFDYVAWFSYQDLLNPYGWHIKAPSVKNAPLFWQVAPYLAWISQMLIYLVVASVATVLILAVWAWGPSSRLPKPARAGWGHVRHYWLELRNSPYRCGLIVLLSWQIVPVIILLHHSLPLYSFFFIFFLPGPCILFGIFLAKTADALKRVRTLSRAKALHREPSMDRLANTQGFSPRERRDPLQRVRRGRVERWASMGRYGVYALATLIIVAQFIGSVAQILDYANGKYSDGFDHGFAYNDSLSLQNALADADQLAQRHHLNRVYISIADIEHTQVSLPYLSTQMHTPTTVFYSNCVPLPSAAEGPAVMLVGPYSDLTNALVTQKNFYQYSRATLIDKPTRSGGAPFSLYIVTPNHKEAISHAQEFSINNGHDLQLLTPIRPFVFNHTPWLVTHWSLLRSASPDYHKTYTYSITMTHVSGSQPKSTTTQCTFTAMRAGDEVLIPFKQDSLFTGSQRSTSSTVSMSGQFYQTNPYYLYWKQFTFLTFATTTTQKQTLQTPEHKDHLTAQVPIVPSVLRLSTKRAKKLGG